MKNEHKIKHSDVMTAVINCDYWGNFDFIPRELKSYYTLLKINE